MTKTSFVKYTAAANGRRSVEESISELQREIDVRRRLLDGWVQNGKISWVDAHDRFERMLSALKHLIEYSHRLDQDATRDTNPPIDFTVDMPPAEQAA